MNIIGEIVTATIGGISVILALVVMSVCIGIIFSAVKRGREDDK